MATEAYTGMYSGKPPPWADGTPYYCACCDGPLHECELPTSRPESVKEATERHARWLIAKEFNGGKTIGDHHGRI